MTSNGMRILLATGLYPPEIGGPATYTKLLERELPKRGIETEVLAFRAVRHLPPGIRHIAYFWKCFRMARYADLVYAQDPVSVGLPALLAARLARRRFLLKIVGDYAWEQGVQRFGITDPLEKFAPPSAEYPVRVRLMKHVERYVANSAEIIIVPSEYLKKIVVAWGVPAGCIRVVHNSFEPPALSGNRAVLRELIKFRGKLIISVGRLVPWKGFSALIDALPAVRKTFPDTKLFVVGTGPQKDELEDRTSQKGLEDAVIFGGAAEHEALMRYLEASDVFVLNTQYEGFSHVLLEAMAVGVPVVTTPVGGNTEIVRDGFNGLLVKPDDKKQLAAAIGKLFSDEGLRQRLIASGKETVARFSIERMVSELVPLLERNRYESR